MFLLPISSRDNWFFSLWNFCGITVDDNDFIYFIGRGNQIELGHYANFPCRPCTYYVATYGGRHFSKMWKKTHRGGEYWPCESLHGHALILSTLTLSWRRPLSYRNQSIDLRANQWSGFYMITDSVMKELNKHILRSYYSIESINVITDYF